MTKTKKSELDRCLRSALTTLEAHTKGLTQDLGSESNNLHDLVSNQDETTQGHLNQLDTLIGDLKKNLTALRSDLTLAHAIASELEAEEDPATEQASPKSGHSAEPDMSGEEASKIRHDEPITLGTVIRSLLMANEPGQREKHNSR
jgi:chromosome segregation ATPase